jgi:hypothetical protein
MQWLLNPATAGIATIFLAAPVLAIGYAIDYPLIESRKAGQVAQAKAMDRVNDCRVLAEGTLQPGYFYVSRDMDAKGRVSETLLPNGERICDRRGPTASVKDKSAGFFRSLSPDQMGQALATRFGIDGDGQPQIPPEALVYPSKYFKPNPAARPPAKVDVATPSQGFWGLFQSKKETNHGTK